MSAFRGGLFMTRTVHHIVKRADEEAGLPFPIHPTCFLSRGFNLTQKVVDTKAIQRFLGDRDVKSTVIYTELDPARFKGLEGD